MQSFILIFFKNIKERICSLDYEKISLIIIKPMKPIPFLLFISHAHILLYYQ